MQYLIMVSLLFLLAALPAPSALSDTIKPASQTKANEYAPPPPPSDRFESSFEVTAGYRRDSLEWNIAGNLGGTDPNILSELNWNHIDIFLLGLTFRANIGKHLYLRSHVDYGIVFDGDNQDSDYIEDNRTDEFSRSLNGVDGNNVWDGSIGVGPQFLFSESAIVVCPLIGYAIFEQDYNIIDGNQVVSAPPATMPIGPFGGLDSRYQTRWTGPWLGIDLLLSIPTTQSSLSAVVVRLSGEYHHIDFDAEANWNLRSDFSHPVSFTQEAEGSGFTAGASILWELKNRLGIHAGISFKEMTAKDGVDRTYFADGSTADTRLNEVRWRALALEAGIAYVF